MRFNEDFRSIHEITDKLGLGHTKNMQIDADNAIIVMVCSGVDARVHLHAFVIMTRDGSVALAKMALKNLVEKAAAELA
jgi:predicted regulator of Ras-like GTPase activity (Roadblock/LC7/MglB family)